MTCPIRDDNLIQDESDNSDNESDNESDYESDDDDDPIMHLNLTPDEMRRYAQWLCDLEYAIFCHFQKE
jgi:hypothetical protein